MGKFKKYYLIWFVIFGLMGSVAVFKNYSNFDYNFLFFLIIMTLVVPLLLGRLIDWTENIWTPKRRKKYYNQEPLSNLLNLGFKNIDDVYFIGVYEKYHIEILYCHVMQRLLIYNFYYEPESFGSEEFDRVYKLIKNKHKVDLIAPGLISFSREIKFKIPKVEVIKTELNKYSKILKETQLKPISKKELEELFKKTHIDE